MKYEPISFKSPFSFGQYIGKTLIHVLVTDKEYLAWCYQQKLEDKYPELKWLWENIKPAERQIILNLQKDKP